MQSNKSLATWASQTYSQTGGVNNWNQYQLSLTGTSSKFNVYAAGSSSTTLSLYDARNRYGNILAAGDTVLLSTNGSTFTSGTLGTQTTTAAPYTVSAISFTSRSLTPGQYPAYYVKPDGTKMWWAAGSPTGSVYEYDIATPYDLSTATKNARTFINPLNQNGIAFCFSPDGTTLYCSNSSTVTSYALTTAWDVTTISPYANGSCAFTLPNAAGQTGAGVAALRFSPDGTKMLIQNGSTTYSATYGGWALYTLNVPWNLNSLASSTTTNYTTYSADKGGSTYTTTGPSEFSPDGMSLFVFMGQYGSPTCSSTAFSMETFTFSSPWNLTTWSRPRTYLSVTGSFGQNMTFMAATYNATGTQISVYSNQGNYANTACDYWTKYNYNVSSYSLGATPTAAYTAAPTVNVDAESTAARVNLFNYELYMASSSTTQAVVYKPAGGVLATGDSLLLNGSTSVTTSAVSQGTVGAVAAVPIYTAANRTYTGKSFGVQTSGSIGSLRISTDGTLLIVMLGSTGTYGSGLYAYSLSTPFDVSTATFSNFLSTSNNGLTLGCFDISPDGTRLIMGSNYVSGAGNPLGGGYVYEYILSQPWNIATAYYNGASWNLNNSAYNPRGIKFNGNGTQVILSYASSTNVFLNYQNCGTPYRIGTCPSGTGSVWVSGASGNPTGVLQTPDGLNIITFAGGASSNVTTSNTLGTAYNMATATQTNNVTSATNLWSWPTGTVTSTAASLCGDFSADGTKFYVCSSTSPSIVWQMNVIATPQTSYTCTYPTQGSAPTSVVLPDRSVAQTVTTTLSGGNMTFAAPTVGTNARGIAMKINSSKPNTTITNATLNLWHS